MEIAQSTTVISYFSQERWWQALKPEFQPFASRVRAGGTSTLLHLNAESQHPLTAVPGQKSASNRTQMGAFYVGIQNVPA